MDVGITINHKLVYDKEFSMKDILKVAGKVLLITSGIVLTNSTLSYASTIPREFFKGEVTQGTMYIILRLIEVVNHGEICDALEWYDNIATGTFEFLGKAGIKASREIPLEALPTLFPYRFY